MSTRSAPRHTTPSTDHRWRTGREPKTPSSDDSPPMRCSNRAGDPGGPRNADLPPISWSDSSAAAGADRAPCQPPMDRTRGALGSSPTHASTSATARRSTREHPTGTDGPPHRGRHAVGAVATGSPTTPRHRSLRRRHQPGGRRNRLRRSVLRGEHAPVTLGPIASGWLVPGSHD